MRELEFHIDHTAAEGVNCNNYRHYGDGLPLYIDEGRCPEERLQQVTSDVVMCPVIHYMQIMLSKR